MVKILSGVEIVYQQEEYVVFRGNDSDYIVYNTNKPFKRGHSHLKSKRRAKEVINNSIRKSFPLHWSNYFIHTMIRLTTDSNYKERLEKLRETRKRKGRKKSFRNVGGRGV